MHPDLQSQLLEEIVSRYPRKSDAVEEISEILKIAKDAVYRRLRGDTLLAPSELSDLARAFNVSLDALIFEQSNTFFFTYNAFSVGAASFEDYLQGFINELEMAQQQPLQQFYYASAELPLFHTLFFPELISFKLYLWGRTLLDFDYLKELKFDFRIIPPDILRVTERMLRIYIDLPGVELWSPSVIDHTLNEIEYHISTGSFQQPKDVLMLYDKLEALSHHIQKMARYGKKFPLNADPEGAVGGSFQLFHNEMVYTNNTALAGIKEGQVLFTTLGNPNFMRSTDPRICSYMEGWFKRVMNKSVPISEHNERDREWFFNRIRKKIAFSRRRMEVELGWE